MQRLYFHADGTPDLGVPVGNGPLPERFQSSTRPETWLAYEGPRLFTGSAPLPNTQFRSLPNGDGTVRLCPILQRESCLSVAADGGVGLAPMATGYAGAAALFRRVRGPDRDSIRLESAAFPDQALALTPRGLGLAAATDPATVWKLS